VVKPVTPPPTTQMFSTCDCVEVLLLVCVCVSDGVGVFDLLLLITVFDWSVKPFPFGAVEYVLIPPDSVCVCVCV